MKKDLFGMKNLVAALMIFFAGTANAQWQINGNSGTNSLNYVGTTGLVPLFLRVNGASSNPGQASLTTSGSFVVDAVNNSNTVNSKGSIVTGSGNVLSLNAGSSIVAGWENDLSTASGANLVSGQANILSNGVAKSVALGWKNTLKNSNEFAIGVGIDLSGTYSGGFGIDIAATADRSFVIGSGVATAKLTNTIPRSIMFGMSTASTMLIRDQQVGIRTTTPTANLHTVGTVRFQDLPNGSGRALVVDANGNVMVATSTITRPANDQTTTELQSQIDDLKKEIQELKALLKQNTVNVDANSSNANEAKLYQNAPNPAKGETSIRYYLPDNSENASITIYNLSGQLVKTIGLREKGNGNITLTGLQSGSYLYQLNVNGKRIDSKKMLIKD